MYHRGRASHRNSRRGSQADTQNNTFITRHTIIQRRIRKLKCDYMIPLQRQLYRIYLTDCFWFFGVWRGRNQSHHKISYYSMFKPSTVRAQDCKNWLYCVDTSVANKIFRGIIKFSILFYICVSTDFLISNNSIEYKLKYQMCYHLFYWNCENCSTMKWRNIIPMS